MQMASGRSKAAQHPAAALKTPQRAAANGATPAASTLPTATRKASVAGYESTARQPGQRKANSDTRPGSTMSMVTGDQTACRVLTSSRSMAGRPRPVQLQVASVPK
jgi:hypothetical protein